MIAAEVSLAFNAVNERKSWAARPHAQDGREAVHFTAPANLVTLVYECEPDRFAVRFNKVQATWGDYVRSIARSLYVVLSTLKVAGLPFNAPDDIEGIEIIVTATETGAVYVRWPGQKPLTVESAIMPELLVSAPPADDVPAFANERTDE